MVMKEMILLLSKCKYNWKCYCRWWSLSDTFKFENINSGSSLTINNFEEGLDSFEFSSAAFSGDMGCISIWTSRWK